MVNGRTENTTKNYLKCTLKLNDHIFQVNLVSMTIESSHVIVGMLWLDPHRADIMCHEKAARLNLPNNKTLIFYGVKQGKGFRIISCMKV